MCIQQTYLHLKCARHCANLIGKKSCMKKIPPVLKVHAVHWGDRHLHTSLLPKAVMFSVPEGGWKCQGNHF